MELENYLSRSLKPEEEILWDLVLRRVEFAYNVYVYSSTLLEMLLRYCPEYFLDIIFDPHTILEWDEAER